MLQKQNTKKNPENIYILQLHSTCALTKKNIVEKKSRDFLCKKTLFKMSKLNFFSCVPFQFCGE